jgi:hypothetical protein
MISKKVLFDTKLFYNTVIFAIVSLRTMKVIAVAEQVSPKKVFGYLYSDAYDSSCINIAKLCDDASGNDVNRLLKSKDLNETQKLQAQEKWRELKSKHADTINEAVKVRNEIVAHFYRNLATFEPQSEYTQEITQLDSLVQDIKKFIEALPWFEGPIINATQYTDIARDLNIELPLDVTHELYMRSQ